MATEEAKIQLEHIEETASAGLCPWREVQVLAAEVMKLKKKVLKLEKEVFRLTTYETYE